MNKIYIIGDSTCQYNTRKTYPQVGWGQFFHLYIKDKYQIINLALNGKSTKSFKDGGYFKTVQDNISKGDYLFIQFGHNDQKIDDPARYTDVNTTYKENLEFYVNEARKHGATPVLLSSIYRRKFENGVLDPNCHNGYPEAMEEVANKLHVDFINMTKATYEFLNEIGDGKSLCYFMNFKPNLYKNYPEGMSDNTHLRPKGARLICRLTAIELSKNDNLKHIVK